MFDTYFTPVDIVLQSRVEYGYKLIRLMHEVSNKNIKPCNVQAQMKPNYCVKEETPIYLSNGANGDQEER